MSEVVVNGVSKAFGGTAVLKALNLSVENGSTTAVVGSSGCGKTTLLRVLAGFEAPDAGSVTIAGRQVADKHKVTPAHRRNVGYVAQDGALFPHLTVAKNIAFGLDRGSTRRRSAAKVSELLEMVALDSSFARRRPHELSGGQQQRIALARALAREPQVMLLDEPFSALDAGLRAATRKSVAQALRAAGVTTILVTHDQEEALSFAGQVAVMRAGEFTQCGTPENVYGSPVDLFTAQFLGDCVLLPARVHAGVAECALGRIPVWDARRGSAARATDTQIMLRPEQLQAQDASFDSGTDVGSGTVTAVEFLGSGVLVEVALGSAAAAVTGGSAAAAVTGGSAAPVNPGGSAAPMITVRQASVLAPRAGDRVRIRVLGQGVVFAG